MYTLGFLGSGLRHAAVQKHKHTLTKICSCESMPFVASVSPNALSFLICFVTNFYPFRVNVCIACMCNSCTAG